jgi:tetratricopeptide (TPR) repeat protein
VNEIEPAIEKFAQQSLTSKASGGKLTNADKLAVSRTSGDLYMSAGQSAAAERWYRRAYGLDPKEYGRLASSVAKQGRVDEAIEICRLAAVSDSSHLPALTLAEVLIGSELSAVDLTAAEAIFADAVARHVDKPELLVAIANLRVTQSRYDDGIKLYRRVIELKPDRVDALNNLAAILADRPDQMAEAVSLLDRAIQFAGPQPNLLDTKGTILLALNRVNEALPLLIEAASSPSPDPRYLFHLAVAHYRAGEMTSARKSFDDARRHKLEGTVLTQSDTKMLAELNEKLQ